MASSPRFSRRGLETKTWKVGVRRCHRWRFERDANDGPRMVVGSHLFLTLSYLTPTGSAVSCLFATAIRDNRIVFRVLARVFVCGVLVEMVRAKISWRVVAAAEGPK